LNRRKRRKRRRAEGEKLKAEKLKLGNERQTEEGRSPGWAGRSAGGLLCELGLGLGELCEMIGFLLPESSPRRGA
jgi:tRNA G46 methylase TrmB